MSDHPGGSNPPSSNNPNDGANPGGQGDYTPPPSYGQPQGGYGQPPGGYGHPGAPQNYGGQYAGPGGSRAGFDLRAIMPGGLIAIVGALLYLVFSFFPWYTIYNYCPFGPAFGVPCSVTLSAWDQGSAVSSVILFLLAGVAFFLKAAKVIPPKVPLEMIALGLVVLGDIFFVVAFFSTSGGLSRGWGLWIDLVVLIVINVGAVLQFISVGGVASARREFGNLQQRASGPSGYGQPGAYPQQPGYPAGGQPPQGGYPAGGQPPQGGYPTGGQPPQGGYPAGGQPPQGAGGPPPPPGGYPQQPAQGGYPQQGQGGYPPQPGQGGYPPPQGQGGYPQQPGQGGHPPEGGAR
jgi:hypothetical protein